MIKISDKKIINTIIFSLILVFFVIIITLNFYLAPVHNYYLTPEGGDSIQQALDKARPGDVIHLSPGIYYQNFDTKRSGTSNAPITITGPADAIIKGVKGTDRGRIALIFHDYYHLSGFTFDGLAGDRHDANAYKDILLYVQGTKNREGVTGLKVLHMNFKNSGGEAIRLRYFAHDNEIAYSTFKNTGVYDFKFKDGGKNGEVIYLGTSSTQWNDGKNPTADPDESNNNWIHHNDFNTHGNEAVDIKEGAKYNLVEHNTVTGQKDPQSGCLDARGDENIFRYNTVYGCVGVGIRLGGHLVNGHQYGINNQVYGNKIYNNKNGGIKFEIAPQNLICGNNMSDNRGGNSVGAYSLGFDPTSKCNLEDLAIAEMAITNIKKTSSFWNTISLISTFFKSIGLFPLLLFPF